MKPTFKNINNKIEIYTKYALLTKYWANKLGLYGGLNCVNFSFITKIHFF